MITTRHLERLFEAQDWRRLHMELTAGRVEGSASLSRALTRVIPLAALGLIRLDELNQSQHPLYRRFLNVILTAQDRDGGWGEPLTTSLCLRALMLTPTHEHRITAGLQYLANLQKPEGIWPSEPIRRLAGDPLVSAFVLLQLGNLEPFQHTVRFHDVFQWFVKHAAGLEPDVKRLWQHAQLRSQTSAVDLSPAESLFARPAA